MYQTIILFCVNKFLVTLNPTCIKGTSVASLLPLNYRFGQGTQSPLVSVSLSVRWKHTPTLDGFG